MADIFNMAIANAPAAGTTPADLVRQNKGYVWYVKRNAVLIGDEFPQELTFSSDPQRETKTILQPRGLAPRELFARVTALNQKINLKTLNRDSYFRALYAGTENQWTAAIGGKDVTITDLAKSATRPSYGAVAAVESYDDIESTIYFMPNAQIRGLSQPDIDGLPGLEYDVTPSAVNGGWKIPAGLAGTVDDPDADLSGGIRIDCLTSQVKQILDLLFASVANG